MPRGGASEDTGRAKRPTASGVLGGRSHGPGGAGRIASEARLCAGHKVGLVLRVSPVEQAHLCELKRLHLLLIGNSRNVHMYNNVHIQKPALNPVAKLINV